MSQVKQLEKTLNDFFTKSTPALPKGGKEFIVRIAPWLTLIVGILSLLSTWTIYRWASTTNALTDYANELSRAYGGTGVVAERWTLTLYLALALLLVTGIIYLMAFSPLRNFSKKGWDLLFYALLINVVYGVVVAFTTYGSFGNLIGSLIGSAIGAYFLFQIRDYYVGKAKLNR